MMFFIAFMEAFIYTYINKFWVVLKATLKSYFKLILEIISRQTLCTILRISPFLDGKEWVMFGFV